jgi:GNAT superfamily N-acetyltransferase
MTITSQIVLIAGGQIHAAGEVLARAFLNDPLCVYTQPDLEARMAQFTWLFTRFVGEGAGRGGVYTNTLTGPPDGVAVWTPPRAGEPGSEAAAAGETDPMGQRFGHEAHRRFTEAYRHFEHVHHQRMAGPHWYLALLGVTPRRQRQGLGRALLTPVLRRADQEGLPCYLETFVPDNVRFYEHCGFRVVEAGLEPRSRVAFWAMKRLPQ